MIYEHGWIAFSLLAALATAFIYILNQRYKVPGHFLVLWQRIFILICFLPFLPLVDWPDNITFYILVACTGVIATLGDIRSFNVVAEYGAGVTSRMLPLFVWVSFLLWFIVEPQQFFDILSNPYQACGIFLSLGGSVYFASHLTKCHVSKQAFIRLAPAITGYGISMVLAKYAFNLSSLHGGVFAYMVVQTIVTLPISAFFLFKDRKKSLSYNFRFTDKAVILVSAALCLGWIVHVTLKNYANSLAENPGYVSALLLTTPLWISLIYRCMGHKEDTNIASGMGIVACSILLCIFAAY